MHLIFDRNSRRVYAGNDNFDFPMVSRGFSVMMFTEYTDALAELKKVSRSYYNAGLSDTRPELDLTIVKPGTIRSLMKWNGYADERKRENAR